MRHVYRVILRLAACLVLWLPGAGFAQNTTTTTISTATVIGPTSAVGVWTTGYVGPQTLLTGSLGTCTASCTIGGGGTCGAARPALTGCSGGVLFPIVPGGIDFDTLTVTQVTAAQAAAQPVPLDPWVPVGSVIGVLLLALFWRFRSARR